MGMAVDYGVVEVEMKFGVDGAGVVPADEGFVNGLVIGVIADGAFAAMAFELGSGRGTQLFPLGKSEILNALRHRVPPDSPFRHG
ncbi:MAG TPA: hypothetical protein VGT03_06065 [Candidatus Acidoferrales bacterium]|nr:hypothetical protein [Candidatus Acidoferrales bacterium]